MLSFDLLLRGFTGLWNNLVLAGPCRQPCNKHRRGLTLSCNRKCKRQSWKKCTHVKTFRALEGNHRNTMVKWRNFGKIWKAARFSALMKTKLNGWALNCRCGPSSYSTEQHRTVQNNTEQHRAAQNNTASSLKEVMKRYPLLILCTVYLNNLVIDHSATTLQVISLSIMSSRKQKIKTYFKFILSIFEQFSYMRMWWSTRLLVIFLPTLVNRASRKI